MNITWYGQSFFQVRIKKGKRIIKVALNPYNEKTGLTVPKVEADILLLSHSGEEFAPDKVKGAPFLIKGPGEYEIKDVMITGIRSFRDSSEGKEKGINTIYKFYADDLRVCCAGELGQNSLTSSQIEKIGAVDVLMVPVGGGDVIDGKKAASIISQIEPNIVVPMQYKIPGLKSNLEDISKFLKEIGATENQPQEELEVTASKLPKPEEMEVTLLSPKGGQ